MDITEEESGFTAASGSHDITPFAFVSLSKGSLQFRLDCGPKQEKETRFKK
jgi:hypothetical protein